MLRGQKFLYTLTGERQRLSKAKTRVIEYCCQAGGIKVPNGEEPSVFSEKGIVRGRGHFKSLNGVPGPVKSERAPTDSQRVRANQREGLTLFKYQAALDDNLRDFGEWREIGLANGTICMHNGNSVRVKYIQQRFNDGRTYSSTSQRESLRATEY